MNMRLWSGTCAAIAFGLAVSLFAQTPPASQSSSSYANAKTITVTGCVERAEQSATGTAGTTGIAGSTGVEEPKFVLTNVTPSASETSASGTAGTSGTSEAGRASIASKYRLDADDAKLQDHVGHKVEITGTVAPTSSAGASTSATEPPSSSSSSSSASSEKPAKLKVDTVKMVSSTCP